MKKSNKYACPRCGSMLGFQHTADFDVDPETGKAEATTRDIYVFCTECSWDHMGNYNNLVDINRNAIAGIEV